MRDFSLVTALGSLARGWTGRYPRIVLVKVKSSHRCTSNVKLTAHTFIRHKLLARPNSYSGQATTTVYASHSTNKHTCVYARFIRQLHCALST